MNSKLHLAFLLVALIAAVNAAGFDMVSTYTDSACTQATGGFYVKQSPDACVPSFETCTENFGAYMKSSCSTTDPTLSLAAGTNVLYQYTSTDGSCTNNVAITYDVAYVGATGVCFNQDTTNAPMVFASCAATVNVTGYIDYSSCTTSDGLFSTSSTSYPANSCKKTAFFDLKAVCGGSATPVAAPTTSATPQAASTPATPQAGSTPAKKSSASSTVAGLGAIAVALVVLA